MKKKISVILILFLIAGNFMSCKKKNRDFPHVLPTTMLIDFSNFVITSQSSARDFETKGGENFYWTFSADIVSPWRTLTTATLSVPIGAYRSAANQKPSNISANKWEWSYNATVGGASHRVRLTGEAQGSQMKWEMYVSRDGAGGFSEFKWLEGTSNTTGTEGKWTFYESHTQQTTVALQVDWTKSGAAEKIKYTNNNLHIEYGQPTGSFSFSYGVHYNNASLGRFSDVNIEWNSSNPAGRVRSADFLDGQWKCWNAQRIDTVCN